MKLKNYIDLYFRGKSQKYNMDDIIHELPENDIIAKDILNKLGNSKTKLVYDKDIKGSYYVFLNDTIYIAKNSKSSKEYSRLTLIAHECVHSIQSKVMQVLNFGFANLEIFMFFIFVIMLVITKSNNINQYVKIMYNIIAILSVIIRSILEIHASLQSIVITKGYINKYLGANKASYSYKVISFQVRALLPYLLISIFFWKIVRMVLVNVI